MFSRAISFFICMAVVQQDAFEESLCPGVLLPHCWPLDSDPSSLGWGLREPPGSSLPKPGPVLGPFSGWQEGAALLFMPYSIPGFQHVFCSQNGSLGIMLYKLLKCNPFFTPTVMNWRSKEGSREAAVGWYWGWRAGRWPGQSAESPVSVLRACCCWPGPGHQGVGTETKHLQPSRGYGLKLLRHPSMWQYVIGKGKCKGML